MPWPTHLYDDPARKPQMVKPLPLYLTRPDWLPYVVDDFGNLVRLRYHQIAPLFHFYELPETIVMCTDRTPPWHINKADDALGTYVLVKRWGLGPFGMRVFNQDGPV